MPEPIYDPITREFLGYEPLRPEMICVITDANGIVVDIASRRENLSCGPLIPGHVEYLDIYSRNIEIGDAFDGTTVTKNQAVIKANAIRQAKRRIIELKVRMDAANAKGYSDIAAEINLEIQRCDADLASLSRP